MTTRINVSQSAAGEPTTAIPTFKGELYLNETDGSIWRAYGLSAGNWYLLTDSNNEFSGSYDDLSDKPTIPVKASGSELDTGTDDAKFATAKALADQTVLEKTSNKKTNLADNSDTYYPTQKAVKTAVDAKLENIVEDTTPELGGNLDAKDKNITGLGSAGFTQELDNGSKTASFTIDFSTDQKQKVTLTSNTMTLTLDTTDVNVGNYILKIVNGGLATLTWASESGSIYWSEKTKPTLTSSGTDIIAFYFDGTNWYGMASLNFGTPA